MSLTSQTNTTLESIAALLKAHSTFAICGHVNPDGDCVGSQLALAHALKALGKDVACLLVRDEPLTADVSFMPGAESMLPAGRYDGTPEVFIGVDVPSRERIGHDAERVLDACASSVTIDHHACETPMCDAVYVDPDSASASILVWKLVKLLCEKPPLESAFCAYAGLASDTGGFCYQNADVDAFECAAELVAYGIDPSFVAMKLFQSRSLASLKLEELVIRRMHVDWDSGFALSWLTKEDFSEHGADPGDAEGMVDVLRSMAGLRVVCMLRDQGGVVRGSLRAKDDTDVASVARALGGGGHTAAAGFTLHVCLADAIEEMKSRLLELLATRPER